MNANHILDTLEIIDDKYIIQAKEHNAMDITSTKGTQKRVRNWRRTLVLAAAIIAVLALCGFESYQFGLFDPWFQKPSANPIETVQSAIENQIDKEYTLSVQIEEIKVDDEETMRVVQMYSSSELAETRGWTDEYLAEHFIVVWAKYAVKYDHTKTFLDDGNTEQYFYLTQDEDSGDWTIVDNTSPNISNDIHPHDVPVQ
ncbi:hypothetical protein Sgly_2085 [Syntrophobotulus glycolicus DSM 8271]|uniref:DUF4829 domain-containing protein n=1 Tax=Syntrophobotulus glycolicus (strain DSM 8271 / FlGlyR) TaxID=645991 RepID=F0T233_SYNGF|nr:hypothetical protein [Syntrophobotulus glycolicus]ADY56377.1 hypothetical protein Sgly_2085 [Syntrophobotulus glycolicus DSM 8271]